MTTHNGNIPTRTALLLGMVALFAADLAAAQVLVPGGGRRKTDCMAVFDVPVPIIKNRWRCEDGDPACDADMEVNGECSFRVRICANSTHDPGSCDIVGVNSMEVDHSEDNGDPKFDPDFQALQARIDTDIEPPTSDTDLCAPPTTLTVRVKGPFKNNVCRRGRKKIRVETRSEFQQGKVFREVDTLRLHCLPAPTTCDPQNLFDSTFDRVQTQIFNESCALSACHDSESIAGGLLLEVGASLGQLVNVTPVNGAADAAGWLRIDQSVAPDMSGENGVGHPATSFIYNKVNDSLGLGMGGRMPLGRPKLNPLLVDIMRSWIEAGAPDTGWVPGTDQ